MIIPITNGIKKDKNAHLLLPVSFFIVKIVVIQGKCNIEKSITHTAVIIDQPLFINKVLSYTKLLISVI